MRTADVARGGRVPGRHERVGWLVCPAHRRGRVAVGFGRSLPWERSDPASECGEAVEIDGLRGPLQDNTAAVRP
eukprot:SAG22_NODE_8991_length_616_cov_0.798839_1_plen_74_part_00